LMQANTDGMPGVGGRGVVTAPGAEALAWRPHGHGTGGGGIRYPEERNIREQL